MAGAFGSDGFNSGFGSSGFSGSGFGSSSFRGSDFGESSFLFSDLILNSHSTSNIFGPTGVPIPITGALTIQQERSKALLNFKYNLDFAWQSWANGGASDFPLPKLDIHLDTAPWRGKAGQLKFDQSYSFDPHADLLFLYTSKQCVYKSPAEKVVLGLDSYGDLLTRTSAQAAWIASDVTGSHSTWIDIHVNRLYNHLPGENNDDCLACISGRLGLYGVGAAVDHC
ncbi:hypothetical protein Focb16_v000036 [Fusarium oxysporum f. sp. cubense]|uniref:Uncharacterized protein n=1 Tax=Fusarium oxysporum f. sp. cubense TaxID=61366 RepID=A0A559L9M0_FUSOC|nr:hypothetical protein Focb16_v000036 [Fusarium oxysporum f. sp. cubense]